MKNFWLGGLALALVVGLAPDMSEAKRLGSGGMQRSMPTRSAPDSTPARPAPQQSPQQGAQPGTPAQQAAPAMAGAAPAAAAAAGKRSWLGPIAGLAAGIGLAALLSHFGLGEAFASGLMMVLLVMAVLAAVAWFMRRRAAGAGQAAGMGMGGMSPAYAGAGMGTGSQTSRPADAAPLQRQAWEAPTATEAAARPGSAAAEFAQGATASSGPSLPPDFDRAGFERAAQLIFIRMQAANDAGDLEDLRRFTTPEMYASVRLDLQQRGVDSQQTDVVKVEAEVLDLSTERDQNIVSVRYHGLIREERGGTAQPFDEIWHMVRPADGSREWAVAGIQPTH